MSYEDARMARIEMIYRHNAERNALGRSASGSDKRAMRTRQDAERNAASRIVFLAIAAR